MVTLLFSSLLEQDGCGYGGTGIKRSANCVSLLWMDLSGVEDDGNGDAVFDFQNPNRWR